MNALRREVRILGYGYLGDQVKTIVYLEDVEEFMGHLAYGYRLNQQGRMEHRVFDIDSIRDGEAKRNGWYDSPDKVPGGPAAIARGLARAQATENTTRREPSTPAHVHGEYAADKPGRGNKGPRDAKGKFVKSK